MGKDERQAAHSDRVIQNFRCLKNDDYCSDHIRDIKLLSENVYLSFIVPSLIIVCLR